MREGENRIRVTVAFQGGTVMAEERVVYYSPAAEWDAASVALLEQLWARTAEPDLRSRLEDDLHLARTRAARVPAP